MESLGNFQFHKFNLNSQRNFYNSNVLTNPIKSRTFSNGFYNNYNKKIRGYSNYIPTNFSQENPYKTNMDLLNKISQDKYPKKKILTSDFESILKYGDISKIDELLPHMIYNDLSFTKNNHLRLVIEKFQNILKFLFSQQKNIMNNNNEIEEMFNNKNSNMNNQIRKAENDEQKINKLIKSNKNQIEQLNQKIRTYKTILKNSGKEYLIPKNYDNSKIYNKNGLYQCQICLGKTFKTREDYQEHFLKEHTNNMTNKNNIKNNYNTYNNITKNYLDSKLNTIKKELTNIILNMQDQSDNNFNDNIKNIEKLKSKTSNNLKMNNYNILNDNDEKISAQLNRLEYEQKEQYEQLNSKINQMKNDVFNELKNLKFKPQQIIKDNSIKEEGKKKIEENKNVDLKNINDNNNDTLNLIYNQDISANNQSQNIIKNEMNSFSNISTTKKISNIEANNNKQSEQINIFPPPNNENNDKKEKLENNDLNNQKNENEIKDKTINIVNKVINEEINQNDNNNINHSTGKYIDKSKIIQEESRKESTLLNQTSNNNINNQDNTLDNKDKIFTNTGDSIIKSQNKLYSSNLNDALKFPNIKNQIEGKEFINKIQERDDNLLFNENKNIEEIKEDYEIIKINEAFSSENKVDNMIKELEEKYYTKNFENLEKDDCEKIIDNIIQNNYKKLKNDKNYGKFFNNLVKKNELTEFLPKDIKISKLDDIHVKDKIDEVNNLRRSEASINNLNNNFEKNLGNLEKNLGKGNYEDFL